MDRLDKKTRSRIMAGIRGDRLGPETAVEGAFRRLRRVPERNAADLPGRPDFALRRGQVAVFVHGCFWHGCPAHYRPPKSNRAFWRRKLDANRERDRRAERRLRRAGWSVLTVWEHDTRKGMDHLITLLSRRLGLAAGRRAARRGT